MNIGIVGLGLIGGSLALDFRTQGHRILGVSRRPETCEQAVVRGIVDESSPDLCSLKAAEVIFLCTPLGAIDATVQTLLPHLQPSTILTDVGSVKAPIVNSLAPRWQNFIGGHPMAGTAESGLDAALSGLFVDRPYVLTPVATTPPAAVEVLTMLVQSLGAVVYCCAPEAHDRAVAWISHLPVMVSAGLIAACLQEADRDVLNLAQTLASSGFRDTSRVGGGNPELGRLMAQYNQTALLDCLHTYRQQIDRLMTKIEAADWTALEAQLSETQQARPDFL